MVFLVDGKRVVASSASAAASLVAKRKYGKRTGVNRETGEANGSGIFTMWERAAHGQAKIGQLRVQRVEPNPSRSLTLRNMASVTIKRLPGGAVAVTGRKLNGSRRKR
jgi:hypothetical protein